MPAARERFDAGELLLAQVDLGLVPELDPAVLERLVEPDPRRLRRGMAELELLHDRDDRGGLERLLEHRQHLQLVLLADALDVLEHRRAAVAHQLHESEIAALAEPDDGFDRVGGFEADIEEDEVRRTAAPSPCGSSRRRRIPRCRRRRRAGSATGSGGCSALRRRRSRSARTRCRLRAGGIRRLGRRRAVDVCGPSLRSCRQPAARLVAPHPRPTPFLAPKPVKYGFRHSRSALRRGPWPNLLGSHAQRHGRSALAAARRCRRNWPSSAARQASSRCLAASCHSAWTSVWLSPSAALKRAKPSAAQRSMQASARSRWMVVNSNDSAGTGRVSPASASASKPSTSSLMKDGSAVARDQRVERGHRHAHGLGPVSGPPSPARRRRP